MLSHLIKITWAICILLLVNCKKISNPDVKCKSIEVLADTVSSHPCYPDGTINIRNPIGREWYYKVNNGALEGNTAFTNLKPGKYVLTAMDQGGCQYEKNIEITTISPGPKFITVKTVLNSYCTGCHSGNNPQAGLNLTNNCDILKQWDRIKARAVDGNPSPMPQSGLLTTTERDKIAQWIEAGHGFNH